MNETAVAVQEKPSPLEVLLSNPDRLKDCPVETIERLYALDKDIRAEQAKREFAEAFNSVQAGHDAGSQDEPKNTQTGQHLRQGRGHHENARSADSGKASRGH